MSFVAMLRGLCQYRVQIIKSLPLETKTSVVQPADIMARAAALVIRI